MLTLQLPHINMHTKKICGKLDKNQFFHHFFQNYKYSYSRFRTIYLQFIHGRCIIVAHSKLSYSCLLCQNAVPSFDFLREMPIIKCTLKKSYFHKFKIRIFLIFMKCKVHVYIFRILPEMKEKDESKVHTMYVYAHIISSFFDVGKYH